MIIDVATCWRHPNKIVPTNYWALRLGLADQWRFEQSVCCVENVEQIISLLMIINREWNGFVILYLDYMQLIFEHKTLCICNQSELLQSTCSMDCTAGKIIWIGVSKNIWNIIYKCPFCLQTNIRPLWTVLTDMLPCQQGIASKD